MPINELIARGITPADPVGAYQTARSNALALDANAFELDAAKRKQLLGEQSRNYLSEYLKTGNGFDQLAGVDPAAAMEAKKFSQGQQAEGQKAAMQYGLAILSIPDEQERAQAWAQVVPQLNAKFGTQYPEAYDVNAKNLLRATFGDLISDPARASVLLQQSLGGTKPEGDSGPVKNWKFRQGLTNADDQTKFDSYVRANQVTDLGGTTEVISGVTAQPVRTITNTVSPDARPETRGAQAAAVDSAKLGVERAANQPKAEGSLKSLRDKTKRLTRDIDSIIPKINNYTAGPVGAVSKYVGGTPAKDVDSTLATIKANLGFQELQEMRNNSPTGGALGSITERELAFLQSVVTNLEQAQSPAQLKRNLEALKPEIEASLARVEAAYNQTYGQQGGGDVDALINKYLGR